MNEFLSKKLTSNSISLYLLLLHHLLSPLPREPGSGLRSQYDAGSDAFLPQVEKG
jgi:hypothetical protein